VCRTKHLERENMYKNISILLMMSALFFMFGCEKNPEELKLNTFIEKHLKEVQPLFKDIALAYWSAATTGKSEDYDKYGELDFKVKSVYSRVKEFEQIKGFKESGQINDPKLLRQIDILYNSYLQNQSNPELLKRITELGSLVEKNFSNFRGTINGEQVSSNQIQEVLKGETDSKKRRDAWLASKQVGPVVAQDIINLVKLRNQAAQKLGFPNFHTMTLTTNEQSIEDLDTIFDELYTLTKGPFVNLKTELDSILADMYGIGVGGLMPWHYHDPFFQDAPQVYEIDLDEYYKDKDVKELAATFFNGLGMPVESILENSDLYERDKKNPHAFCTDIDREGDVRILCNLQNNERWMETMLHELGHAVYDKFQDKDNPFLLRVPAHIFTTEAIAMFFGRLSRNGAWMQQMLGLSEKERQKIETVSDKYAQLKQLIFARWAMVMYNFEKELYANPEQDLDTLWWDIVEKYQLVKKPAGRKGPDWAAKIHFTIAPCYYHNYLLGELLASQLHNHLITNVLNLNSDKDVSYIKQDKAGEFFLKEVFQVGATKEWNDMIAAATGERLTPKYFVDQFVK
jgi:peptidyl-dipeptidase A